MFDCATHISRNHDQLMEMSEEFKFIFEELQDTESKEEELKESVDYYRQLSRTELCQDIERLEKRKEGLVDELKQVETKLKERRLRLCKSDKKKRGRRRQEQQVIV